MNNLIGRRFGKLTVIEKTEQRKHGSVVWECHCDCGREIFVSGAHLADGNTTSCGCAHKGVNAKDITGQRFGRLVAISPTEHRLGHSIMWLCQCDCGNQKEVAEINLRKGDTRSCGCLSSEVHRKNFDVVQRAFSASLVDGTNIKQLGGKMTSANKSGTVGVYWDKSVNLWKASITFKHTLYRLGGYSDKRKAIEARKRAEEEIHGKFLEWYENEYSNKKGTGN